MTSNTDSGLGEPTQLLRALDLLTLRAPTKEARLSCRDLARRLRDDPRSEPTPDEAELVSALAEDFLE